MALNPTKGLELPVGAKRRDRIASPGEAARADRALPVEERASWATAMYSGLRYGELAALQWPHVDLYANVIGVEQSWDPEARQLVEPKSKAGRRTLPIPAVLREHLIEDRLPSGRSSGLVFQSRRGTPVDSSAVKSRAVRAWERSGADEDRSA